jgi:hypothetical protein
MMDKTKKRAVLIHNFEKECLLRMQERKQHCINKINKKP